MASEVEVAVLALGRGQYVVEGERAYRFCPKYPTVNIISPEEELRSTQTEFLAIALRKKDFHLLRREGATLVSLSLNESEKHGTWKHLASTYDANSASLKAGIHFPGPRVLNFADILKYNYVALPQLITELLETMHETMGGPIDLEYAVQLKSMSQPFVDFYVLLVKPMIGQTSAINLDI